MATGISLHVGINRYDTVLYKKQYDLRLHSLAVCEQDAMAYHLLAERFGFKPAILKQNEATANALLKGISFIGRHLQKGDTFFLSFSGHGTLVPGRNSSQAWCLHNQLVTYEMLIEKLQEFSPGVRIIIVADCCHATPLILRQLPDTSRMQATGLLMAACQYNQQTRMANNQAFSLYTYWVMQVLKDYNFCGSYRELHSRVAIQMPKEAQPSLLPFGPGGQQFIRTRPFLIGRGY
jgi:metacaspase-1